MNAEMKLGLVLGFLKGLINHDEYYTTIDVRKVKEFLKEIEGEKEN